MAYAPHVHSGMQAGAAATGPAAYPGMLDYLVICHGSGGLASVCGVPQSGRGGEPQAGQHLLECQMCTRKGNVEHSYPL